ncbi:MAG: guanylate kinase [Ginsengibacter sp.]
MADSDKLKSFKKIILITAPSGAGKTSIVKYLLNKIPALAFSISATTRPARSTEINGQDYYFLSEQDFKDKIYKKEFLEWEMVYEGKYYGTLKSEIERIWGNNKIPVLDIDVQGAIHVQQQYPINTTSIFIQAPSVDALRERLSSRGTESESSIETRISKASYEITFKDQFKFVVVNDELDRACKETESIVDDFINN